MRWLALTLILLAGVSLAVNAAAYAAWRQAQRRAPEGALVPPAFLPAFLAEWVACLLWLLARPWRLRRRPPVGDAARGTLVLVPEARASAASFWWLRRRLARAGWDSVAAPGAGAAADLDAAAAALDAWLHRLPPSAAPLVLIGHGVGGLVAQRCAQRAGAVTVRRVVTLGSPHQGSSALPYRMLGVGATAPTTPATAAATVDLIAIYSEFDAWLRPLENAYCPGAFNIAIHGVGHCATLLSPRVAALVVENLAAPHP